MTTELCKKHRYVWYLVFAPLAVILLISSLFLNLHNPFNAPLRLCGLAFFLLAGYLHPATRSKSATLAIGVGALLSIVLGYTSWTYLGVLSLIPAALLFLLISSVILLASPRNDIFQAN